jgi:hypothetical protein
MPQAESESPGCAIALVVIGLLILIPSGLCTTLMGSQASQRDLGVVLSVGGPFILIGAGLLFFGVVALRNRGRTPPDKSEPPG